MKIFDVSMAIHEEMAVYNNDPVKRPEFITLSDHVCGNVHGTKVAMDMHTGTHIDMPLHMIKEGSTLDTFDITTMLSPVKVFDLSHLEEPMITEADLLGLDIQEKDFIIFKTKNSFTEAFIKEFVYLERSGSLYLKSKKIKGVGIDALGIERAQKDHLSHIQLLEDGVVILEGLRLKEIEPGNYFLMALPLKIKHVEASPVRALLIQGDVGELAQA